MSRLHLVVVNQTSIIYITSEHMLVYRCHLHLVEPASENRRHLVMGRVAPDGAFSQQCLSAESVNFDLFSAKPRPKRGSGFYSLMSSSKSRSRLFLSSTIGCYHRQLPSVSVSEWSVSTSLTITYIRVNISFLTLTLGMTDSCMSMWIRRMAANLTYAIS